MDLRNPNQQSDTSAKSQDELAWEENFKVMLYSIEKRRWRKPSTENVVKKPPPIPVRTTPKTPEELAQDERVRTLMLASGFVEVEPNIYQMKPV